MKNGLNEEMNVML